MWEVVAVKIPKIVSIKVSRAGTFEIKESRPIEFLLATSDVTGIPVEQIIGRSRIREVKHARQLYMYTTRAYTKYSLQEIANEIERDHATVMYSHSKICDWLDIPAYARKLKPVINDIVLKAES